MGRRVKGTIPVGALVTVKALPGDLGTSPAETRAAFEVALGKRFRVVGHGRYGHLELELGPEIDALLGGFMNTIWIEPDLVEEV
jgi:hypothetical protein